MHCNDFNIIEKDVEAVRASNEDNEGDSDSETGRSATMNVDSLTFNSSLLNLVEYEWLEDEEAAGTAKGWRVEMENTTFTAFMSCWQALNDFCRPMHRVDSAAESRKSSTRESFTEEDLFCDAFKAKIALNNSEHKEPAFEEEEEEEPRQLQDNQATDLKRTIVKAELSKASMTLVVAFPALQPDLSSQKLSRFLDQRLQSFSITKQVYPLQHKEWIVLLCVLVYSFPLLTKLTKNSFLKRLIEQVFPTLQISLTNREFINLSNLVA